MSPYVARYFASACGVTDQSGIFEIERLNDRCQIIGVPIHVVPGRGLAGPAMAPTVVGDNAKSILRQEQHLSVPCIGTQRPSV